MQQPPGPGKPQDQKHAKILQLYCLCSGIPENIAPSYAFRAGKPQNRSARGAAEPQLLLELKGGFILHSLPGAGGAGGAQSSIWEGFKHLTTFAEHPTPSQPSPDHGALGMSPPGRGCRPPGSAILRKPKLHTLWSRIETCCFQSLLNSSGLIMLLVHFWGKKKKNLAHKVTSGLCLKQSQE